MSPKLCIAVCENFKDELLTAIELEGYEDVKAFFFPARCGQPPLTLEEIEQHAEDNQDFGQTYLIGGCCIAKLRRLIETSPQKKNHYVVHKFDQCFYLFADPNFIDSYLKTKAYLLTPGWLKNWQYHVNNWGFSKELLREFLKESTNRLILLDTGIDKNSDKFLCAFADMTNRPYEVVSIGLGYFRQFIKIIIMEWKLDKQKQEAALALNNIQKDITQYALAMDLLNSLSQTMKEKSTINKILEIFNILFAPKRLFYLSYKNGKLEELLSASISSVDDAAIIRKRLADFKEEFAWTESGKGFRMKIGNQKKRLGVVEVDNIAFPEYKEHYLNLALNLIGVCAMALNNSRQYQAIIHKEEQLEKALKKNEILVREIHHRVKNNMQSIISMIRLEYSQLSNEHIVEIFKKIENRIKSMAFIHEKLYQENDLNNIHFLEYLEQLSANLFRSFGVDESKINLRLDVENVLLSINKAIPCGLIINELITNAMKYAFPGDRNGEIAISLHSIEDNFELVIADNGIGLPANFNIDKTESMGLLLVQGWVKQILGTMSIVRTNGIAYYIQFSNTIAE